MWMCSVRYIMAYTESTIHIVFPSFHYISVFFNVDWNILLHIANFPGNDVEKVRL
jgi:hypothetical protein